MLSLTLTLSVLICTASAAGLTNKNKKFTWKLVKGHQRSFQSSPVQSSPVQSSPVQRLETTAHHASCIGVRKFHEIYNILHCKNESVYSTPLCPNTHTVYGLVCVHWDNLVCSTNPCTCNYVRPVLMLMTFMFLVFRPHRK